LEVWGLGFEVGGWWLVVGGEKIIHLQVKIKKCKIWKMKFLASS
jgi:hypothetical protein